MSLNYDFFPHYSSGLMNQSLHHCFQTSNGAEKFRAALLSKEKYSRAARDSWQGRIVGPADKFATFHVHLPVLKLKPY